MKLPRDMDAVELIKALGRLGYRAVRQSGSHVRLQCDDPVHAITIPNHRPCARVRLPPFSPKSLRLTAWSGMR